MFTFLKRKKEPKVLAPFQAVKIEPDEEDSWGDEFWFRSDSDYNAAEAVRWMQNERRKRQAGSFPSFPFRPKKENLSHTYTTLLTGAPNWNGKGEKPKNPVSLPKGPVKMNHLGSLTHSEKKAMKMLDDLKVLGVEFKKTKKVKDLFKRIEGWKKGGWVTVNPDGSVKPAKDPNQPDES